MDLYPSRAIDSSNEDIATTQYNLLKKAAGKQGLVNQSFGIDLGQYYSSRFMLGARFYDSVYPHLSISKEIRTTITTNSGATMPIFYCHWRYRTVIIGGDGTVVVQD